MVISWIIILQIEEMETYAKWIEINIKLDKG